MPALSASLDPTDFIARSSEAVILADPASGRILEVNPAAVEMSEYTADDLLGRALGVLFPPEARDAAEIARRRLSEKTGFEIDCAQLRRSDGSLLPCRWSGWLAAAGGRPCAVLIARDRSDEVRAMEEIRLRNAAIGSVNSGVTIADARLPDLPLIYVNEGFERITGYRAREAVGRSCRFLQGPDRDQPGLDELRRCLKEGISCEVRLRNRRKNGDPFWNELHISPVFNEENELTHFIGIQIDVTDRVESRQRLEESEERYRTLADSIDDIIARRSLDGRILFLSPSIQRHLGETPEHWLGQPFAELVHPDERAAFERESQSLGDERPSFVHSFQMRRSDGRPIWVEATENFVRAGPEGPHIVSVIRDITQRRMAIEETKNALTRERELNRMKTSFISMVSHEFRTPMTGIGASAAFLEEYGEKVQAAQRDRHYKNIQSSLGRMNRLLDDVLLVGRNESGQVSYAPQPTPWHAFCRDLIQECLAAYPGRTIHLDSELARAALFHLDPVLLHHALQNLLTNALKYSPVDRPVRLSVEPDEAAQVLEWRVRDEGIGIPEADQPRLFEAFRRARNVGSINGTGLGLYIAKRSIELHEGTLSFTSSEGKGTEFIFTTPLQPA